MPVAVDPSVPFTFVLAEERVLPPEKQTKFKLKALTCGELAQVEDNMASFRPEEGVFNLRSGSQTLRILKLGLVGVENFLDAKGAPVPFEKNGDGAVAEGFLDRIMPGHRRELANAITEQARLSEAERGN